MVPPQPPRQPLAINTLPKGEASRELAAQVQTILDEGAKPQECAERIVALCDRAVAARHVDTLPKEAYHIIERLRRLNRGLISSDKVRVDAARQDEQIVPYIGATLKAALLGEPPPTEGAPPRETTVLNAALHERIERTHEWVNRTDPEVIALRAHVHSLKKLTPALAQKVLRPVQKRMQAEAYRFILETVQTDKNKFYSTAKGKDGFVDSVCTAIASKMVAEGGVGAADLAHALTSAASLSATAGGRTLAVAPIGAGVVDPNERNRTTNPSDPRLDVLKEQKAKLQAAHDNLVECPQKASLAVLLQRIDAQIELGTAARPDPATLREDADERESCSQRHSSTRTGAFRP